MINSFPNKDSKKLFSYSGAVALVVTVILIVMSTLIIIFAANFAMIFSKSTANLSRNSQSFQAAEAGLEFGINYLKKNSATILAGPVSGFIPPFSDTNTTNVALANGSKFTVVYTNPIANNYNLILVTSTGTNDDGSSTRVVSQQLQFGSVLLTPSTTPLVTQGNVSMSGSATISNTQYNTTVSSGGNVSLSGSSQTVLSGGVSSTSGSLKSDVQTNSTSLANMTQTDFFATYFGNSSNAVKSQMAHVYNNSSSTNYSSTLNGMTGTSIWIDQTGGTASISGNTIIGSPTAPVLLVVNGNLSMSGNVTIYGYIFAFGTNTLDSISGNVNITGGMASADNLNMSGNIVLNYSATTLTNLQNLSTLKYYAKVPGSWKDF